MPHITFETWKSAYTQWVIDLCGMHPDDLPDWDSYSAWQNGVTPATAAKQTIKAARSF